MALARPGYELELAKAVLCTEGSVAEPCDGAKANLDGVLTGRTRDRWVHWQDHILRVHESQQSAVRPISMIQELSTTLIRAADVNGASGCD